MSYHLRFLSFPHLNTILWRPRQGTTLQQDQHHPLNHHHNFQPLNHHDHLVHCHPHYHHDHHDHHPLNHHDHNHHHCHHLNCPNIIIINNQNDSELSPFPI